MITYHNINKLPQEAQGCTLLIGNFDGVHKGHQALIEQGKKISADNGTKLAVMTFDPHPRVFFEHLVEPFCLAELPMKERLLAGHGIDILYAIPFDEVFSKHTADDFIDLLSEKLKAKHIVVGEDFFFGANRSGNIRTLNEAAESGLFKTTIADLVKDNTNGIFSSTRVRNLLREGRLDEAEKLLGWRWEIESKVVKGDQRGRTLGYATANQQMKDYVRIPYGVYAVEICIEGEDTWRHGVANFGIRPMFRTPAPIFETHIFDFNEEIYGKTMRTKPIQHLRGEKNFESIEELLKAMEEDCHRARSILQANMARKQA